MDLTEEEVREILDLIDNSSFDFLELEVGELKLTVSKGAYAPTQAPSVEAPAATKEPVAEPPAPQPDEPIIASDGLVPIIAPMVGTFYAAPKPGAPRFVEEGSSITPDTTVGLIEVMKVFTGIRAGVDGVIERIVVSDAEFVEYGQVLFLLRPNTDAAAT